MFVQHRLLLGSTRPPETARPRQVLPTQQPLRSLAKERASQPNSASDDFSKLPYRRRQVITTFPFGSAVDRSILDKQSVSSNPPVFAFLLFCFFFFLLYVSSNPPVSAFFFFLLLYCCCTVVHTWWVRGLLLVDEFFCCVLCFTAVPDTTYCCTCLLYTSPSPRDQRGSRMPSSA